MGFRGSAFPVIKLATWVGLLLSGPQPVSSACQPQSAGAVADFVEQRVETDHPYSKDWTVTFRHPGASFIAVHLQRLDLAAGDRLEVSSPDGSEHHVYSETGPLEGASFWALSIEGEEAVITLHRTNLAGHGFGVVIDRWSHGFSSTLEPDGSAVCDNNDSLDAACYQDGYPIEFERSRAVVKILVKGGTDSCTGWLASCQNHIVTVNHCIGTQADLDQAEFQFDYRLPDCGAGNATVPLKLQGGSLLRSSAAIDYSLILPSLAGNDPQAQFGFLRWDLSGAAIDQQIYIPQHPGGQPRKIALSSSNSHDESGRCEVSGLAETACYGGPPDIGYYCDTAYGASGSPVIAVSSQRVTSLHHCGSCPNRGVPIGSIYADIQGSGSPLPECSACPAGPPPSGLWSSVNAPNRIDLSWSPAAGAAKYRIYRSRTGCDTSLVEIGTSSTTSFQDNTVSGGSTYYYRVLAENNCLAPSTFSNCTSQTATGRCTIPPSFTGIASVSNRKSSTCTLDLSWNPAVYNCGSSVRYNVYRSLTPGFVPSASTRIASCITGSSYSDSRISAYLTYYYLVRAEDNVPGGTGPCGGNEDSNNAQLGSAPSGPDDVYYHTGFETMSGWTLQGDWQRDRPQGLGGTQGGGDGGPDPAAAFLGSYVIGNDLTGLGAASGNYENSATPHYATSPTFSAAGKWEARIRFRRWLGVEGYDKATCDAYDGSTWGTIYASKSGPVGSAGGYDISDSAWTLTEYDASSLLAGKTNARVRFGIESDGSVVFSGWNIDELDVYTRTSCTGLPPGLPPVPDGRFAPGTPHTAIKNGGSSTDTHIRWDVSHCASENYHLFMGDKAGLPTYHYSSALCAIGNTGDVVLPINPPPPGDMRWWLIVGFSGTTDGHHGFRSTGVARPASGVGLCGIATDDKSGSCP